jgi:hypothetical protein
MIQATKCTSIPSPEEMTGSSSRLARDIHLIAHTTIDNTFKIVNKKHTKNKKHKKQKILTKPLFPDKVAR